MSLDVGSTLQAKVSYGMSGGTALAPERGVVVYVHPKRIFITVEFTFPKGSFRESYMLRGRLPGMLGDEPEDRLGRRDIYAPGLSNARFGKSKLREGKI